MSLTQEQDKTITIYNPEAIMTTYEDLKSVKYIDATINFVEGLRGIVFKRTGKNRYSSYCPFHLDRKDSFRVYVDGKDEVKFHCHGECKMNWDIYDLIRVRNKCRFQQAQQTFADFLGIIISHLKPKNPKEFLILRSVYSDTIFSIRIC